MQTLPSVPDLLSKLEAFGAFAAEATAVSDVNWLKRPAPDEWSLTMVMCHLRDVEREIYQSRFRAVLAQENSFLPGVTSDEWAETRRYQEQNGRQAAADFIVARRETVALLQPIQGETWQRLGRHAFFGPTSLHELLYMAVKHDRTHQTQIEALIGE